ncbi:hypothetical protein [Kitasatospora sp. NPDC058478]|uniref:hypothetical protein n=1 Tax=unclassified Kitasatospora TaxID=2633591 RepID=UPI0036551505
MHDGLADWIRFARAHHFRKLALAIFLLAVVNLLFGAVYLELPFADRAADSPIPFRKEMPLAFASVAAVGLDSAMCSLELTGTLSLRRYEVVWVAGSFGLSTAVLALEELAMGPSEAVLAVRSMIIWGGFAVFSGRVFGWRLSWVLPLLTVFPLTYWEIDASGNRRWWDWAGQPASSWNCWVIAAMALLVIFTSIHFTPWRIARGKAKFLVARVSNTDS